MTWTSPGKQHFLYTKPCIPRWQNDSTRWFCWLCWLFLFLSSSKRNQPLSLPLEYPSGNTNLRKVDDLLNDLRDSLAGSEISGDQNHIQDLRPYIQPRQITSPCGSQLHRGETVHNLSRSGQSRHLIRKRPTRVSLPTLPNSRILSFPRAHYRKPVNPPWHDQQKKHVPKPPLPKRLEPHEQTWFQTAAVWLANMQSQKVNCFSCRRVPA